MQSTTVNDKTCLLYGCYVLFCVYKNASQHIYTFWCVLCMWNKKFKYNVSFIKLFKIQTLNKLTIANLKGDHDKCFI